MEGMIIEKLLEHLMKTLNDFTHPISISSDFLWRITSSFVELKITKTVFLSGWEKVVPLLEGSRQIGRTQVRLHENQIMFRNMSIIRNRFLNSGFELSAWVSTKTMQRPLPRNDSANSQNHEINPFGTLEAALSCLWILTPISATVSLLLVSVGITTNQWLHTSEKMANPAFNGTGDKEYLTKLTVSGLWVFCFTNREYNAILHDTIFLIWQNIPLLFSFIMSKCRVLVISIFLWFFTVFSNI